MLQKKKKLNSYFICCYCFPKLYTFKETKTCKLCESIVYNDIFPEKPNLICCMSSFFHFLYIFSLNKCSITRE